MTVKLGKAICTRKRPAIVAGMFETMMSERVEVRVLAIAEGYAMVRRKGALPFVCQVKELSDPTAQKGEHATN